MNNSNIKIHELQRKLIKKLTLKRSLRFNELLIKGLESEHMNYHLKELIRFGFITKIGVKYDLTDIGKDYSNLLDSETDLIEKQPKVSIIINCVRKNKSGEIEHLLTKKLKQPYFGKVGRMTGKIRFGETFEEAASRELYEEAGLKAKILILEEIYRKMRKNKSGEWIQDVIFYRFFAKQLTGQLIKKTEGQKNFWITKNKFMRRKDLDPFDDLILEDRFKAKPLSLRENVAIAQGF